MEPGLDLASEDSVTPRRAELLAELRNFDVVLLAVVAALSVATVSIVGLRLDIRTGGLDLVINTITAVAAAAAAALAWARYQMERDRSAVYESSAFLALFATRGLLVVVAILGYPAGLGLTIADAQQWPVYGWTAARLGSALLLLLAARIELGPRREARGGALPILVLPTLGLLGLIALLPSIEGSLPTVLDPQSLIGVGGESVPTAAMTAPAVLVQAAIAGMYLWGASIYRRLFRERGRRYTAYLSLALVVAAFSQVHWAIAPGIYAPVVTTDDLLRAVMSVILLVGIEEQSRDDVRRLREANSELEDLRTAEVERSAQEAGLAREIHDGMAQDLWLAKLKLSRLAAVDDLSGNARALSGESLVAVDRALGQARAAVATIRAGADGTPLGDSVAGVVAEFSERSGLRTELALDEVPDVPPRVRAEALHVLREALANVQKHADATVVRVALRSEDGVTELSVADNGRGFESRRTAGSGFGLRGMRERAALIGGDIAIQTKPQGGTRVALRLRESERRP